MFEGEKSRVDYEVGSGQLISGLVTRGKESYFFLIALGSQCRVLSWGVT